MERKTSRLKQLIAVAKEGSSERRRDLLREITDVFMASPDRYTSSEMQHFDVIMSSITQKMEMALRQEIAEKLADVPDAPRGLINQLANDEISVAEPVLRRSVALTENDLLQIIKVHSQKHMAAISRRKNVSEAVSTELVERGETDVLVRLAENKTAKINARSMEKLVDKSRTMSELQAPITARYDLAPQLLTQMYFFVSSALRKEILKRSETLDPAIIDMAIKKNRQKILSQTNADTKGEIKGAQDFIAERARNNAINQAFIKELIETKRHTEFLYAFAHLVGIDVATLTRILQDRSWESLAIASRASDIERSTFAKIVFGLRRPEEGEHRALRILDLYLKIPQDAAKRVMRFWQVRTQTAMRDAEKAAEETGSKKSVACLASEATAQKTAAA